MQNLNTYDALIFFATFVEQGTLKQTCEVIGIDFKTLKKKIELLESTLKTTLVSKGSKGLDVTDEGMKLYSLICNDLKFIDKKLAYFKKDNNIANQDSQMSLLLHPVSALYFSSYMLPKIEKTYPNLAINIDTLSYSFMMQHGNYVRTLIEKYDIIIINKRVMHLIDDQKWLLAKVFVDQSHLYATKEYLNQHPINSINDLKKCRLITCDYMPDLHRIKLKANDQKFSINCHNVLPVENDLINLYLTQNSLGIGIIRDITINANDNHQLVKVLPEYELLNDEVYKLIYKTNPFISENIKAVLEVIKELYPL